MNESFDGDVPMLTVLSLVGEFEASGGASIQLAAWELDVDEHSLDTVWSRAIGEGLLECRGAERVDGRDEEMWVLSSSGRELLMAPQARLSG